MVMLLIFKSFELNEKIVCLEMDICLYLNTKYCWFTFFVVLLLLFLQSTAKLLINLKMCLLNWVIESKLLFFE
jgi:hypothetical protein